MTNKRVRINSLISKLQSLSLRWKINITGAFIVLIFSTVIFFMILPFLKNEKLEERKGKLRAVVNSAVSLMDHYERTIRLVYYDKTQKGEARKKDPDIPLTLDEAKTKTLKILRQLRYDKTEYFFILDGNGNMVMHPLKPELEGQNVLDIKDPNGQPVFREMVINSQRDGEAFISYIWQSKYSPIIFEPQTTYAKYFWPWDWVVCSGLYTQDIIDSMRMITIKSAAYDIITAIVTMGILFLVIYVSLSRPLAKLLFGIKEIHNGNLEHQISVASMDEIGYVAQEFNLMITDLKKSRDNILKSEKKYRELTDMLPDIIYEANINLLITYINNTGITLIGFSDDDIKKGLSIKDLVSDELFIKTENFINRLDGNKDRKLFATHKIIRKDGGYIYGENNMALVFDGDTPVGVRGIIRDVTEKLKMEEALLQSQKMETIGTLAGGLAHDFNNVLGGITGTLSLIRFEIEQEEKTKINDFLKYFDTLEKSARRAADMVQQVLSLAHKHEVSFVPVDLSQTVKHVKKICDTTFDKSIEIIMNIPEGRLMVHADPTQIEQVLLNLCVNANHAMTIMRNESERMGGKLSISIEKINMDEQFASSHPESKGVNYWNLSVGDSGVGMNPKTIAKIFVPFFTTKGAGKGTGLGLSMVYNIVHQHAGFIDVYSEIGIGSTFNIYLPVFTDDGEVVICPVDAEIPKGKGLILVVDDDEVMRLTARAILEKCGYDIITATDGEKGVALYKERHNEIAAVITDLVMPKKSGEQVYLEMKAIDDHVKVILASGFRQDDRVEMALSHGINGFIQKPYTLEKLAKVMHNLLQG